MARKVDPALRQRWHKLVRRQAQSGLSVAAFCREHDCSAAAFYLWRRKLAQQPDLPAPAAFLPVSISHASSQSASIRVCLASSGAVIEIPAEQTGTLLQLVDHLQRTAETIQP